MSTVHTTPAGTLSTPSSPADIEAATRQWGEKIFALMDAAEPPSLFSRKGFYGTMMDWAMRDEHFKTQLFRFVDVLPTLTSSSEIARHLDEYLGPDQVELSPALRLGLKAAGGASWLLGAGVKSQVTGMARQFMLGNEPKEILATLRSLSEQNVAFTVDVLGEAVVSEVEADRYAQRYLDLMDALGNEIAQWPVCQSNLTARGPLPTLNLSVKVSALYSQIHPTDPDTAISKISARLRPILRRAKQLSAFVNLDMESYALKELTLRLFQTIFAEEEFATSPACGLALQAYLRDCEQDLRRIISWSRQQRRRVTVRLVKGAYWDYETIIAQQRRWPVPVFLHKAQSDANFEKLSLLLLENDSVLDAAFGTHNVRSIAHVLAHADHLALDRRNLEFQMLYGMADPIKAAVRQLGLRLREYCPVGELLPGIAYFVRRLLENTSNEGFLASKFAKGSSREELLQSPASVAPAVSPNDMSVTADAPSRQSSSTFQNEPHTDFTIPGEREKIRAALKQVRAGLGRRYPLVINNKPVSTADWSPSLNPANQKEVVGYAAQAGVKEAELALAAARAAQPSWGRTPPNERALVLEKVAFLMHRDKADLCALEVLEASKNWTEADADVAEAIDFCNFYATVMRDLGRPQRTQRVAGESNVQEWRARGLGVIIAPWNFPL
ncbi:MAG TPA: proline dehydrogenase family protein, partial [Verrucomicrobiae bacterium]